MQVPIGFDYVLVLEWLAEGDQRTGAQLHAFLQSIGFNSELVVCSSWDEIQQALNSAAQAVPTRGVPVVHVETHGSSPWHGDPENIGFGVSAESSSAWAKLGPLLAPLNVTAGFRLLVVSAACWGSGVIAAIESGDHPAPFACALGLRTEVSEGRLRDAMREFYRSLRGGLTLSESVDNAQRELEEGQELRLEIIVMLAAKMLWTAYNRRMVMPSLLGALRRRRRARSVWDSWFPAYLQVQVPVYRFENGWQLMGTTTETL
jgi:hypothetical protein